MQFVSSGRAKDSQFWEVAEVVAGGNKWSTAGDIMVSDWPQITRANTFLLHPQYGIALQ